MFWLKLEINTVDTQICERVVQRPLDRPHAAAVKQRSSMLGVARIRCGNAHTGRCRFRKRLPTCRDSHQVTLTSVVVTHADAELQIKSSGGWVESYGSELVASVSQTAFSLCAALRFRIWCDGFNIRSRYKLHSCSNRTVWSWLELKVLHQIQLRD